MKKNYKICFYCGQKLDINSEKFVKPNKVRYAHEKCHKEFISKREDVGVDFSAPTEEKICFYCKKSFQLKDGNYRMPRINRYAHIKCYEANYTEDEEWIDQIYTFLTSRGFKYKYQMCERQRNKMVKENGYTNKGIFLTLKYFYEVRKGDFKRANGGIGIVPFVYSDAANYYVSLANKKKRLEKAAQEPKEVRQVEIKQKTKKKRQTYDLD